MLSIYGFAVVSTPHNITRKEIQTPEEKQKQQKPHVLFSPTYVVFFFFFLTGQQDVGINVLPPTDPQLMFNS